METTVRAKIDADTKQAAIEILSGLGLSVSDAIRLMLINVVNSRTFHISAKVPSKATRQAIDELESGKGKRSKNLKAFYRSMDEKG